MPKAVSPILPDLAQGDMVAPVTVTRGLLLRLREFGAMYYDIVYWNTGKLDQSLLRCINQADEALVASNPKGRDG